MEKTLIIINKVDEINKLAEFIEGIGEELGLDFKLIMNLNLVMEEAVSNIILYAYPKDVEGNIKIKVIYDNSKILFEIKDKGFAFDPTKDANDADIEASVEERRIGGLGIFLIKEMMDVVEYERVNDENIFRIEKKIYNN